MLSPLDDYPYHQAPLPMAHPATSDRNFYDRYYFNCHPSSDELFLIAGLGQYPNLGVADAFVMVRHGDTQQVVRASRALGGDRRDTTVGPIRVEVVEPLHTLRLVCEPNEWGLACDLTWDGSMPAVEEPRHLWRQNGKVVLDASRLAQNGRWTGTLEVGGTTHQVTPDRWWGSRDRSWGIRPVGEPEPPGYHATLDPGGFFWLYVPMQFDDHSVLVIVQEDTAGTRILEEAIRVWNDPDRPVQHLGRPEYELELAPGTRDVTAAALHLRDPDGGELRLDVEPLLPVVIGLGAGYGLEPDWRHGMWQGELEVQGRTYDLADPEVQARFFGLRDCVARATATGADGSTAVGHGLLEVGIIGPHRPTGLDGW